MIVRTKEVACGYGEIWNLETVVCEYGCMKEVLYNGEWINVIDLEDFLYENYEYRYSILKIGKHTILKVYD